MAFRKINETVVSNDYLVLETFRYGGVCVCNNSSFFAFLWLCFSFFGYATRHAFFYSFSSLYYYGKQTCICQSPSVRVTNGCTTKEIINNTSVIIHFLL